MDSNEVPLFIDSGSNAPKEDLPFVERNSITVALRNPSNGKYLGLKWKGVDWETLITGGVEEGQTAEEAAKAEILEETGYRNVRLIAELPRYDSQFFHHPKGVNRYAHFRCFLFELENDERNDLSKEEQAKHEPVWLSPEELKAFNLPEGHRFALDHAQQI